MPPFRIDARDGAARAGVLLCARGEVATPAFVPLASNASVRGLAAAEVAELGFQMVLGNTFHLFIDPGSDYVNEMGGLHELMGWRAPIITDSGGFQVFSMGHGSVSEEIKRRRGPTQSRILAIEEAGVRFRSYTDGRELFMGPETSMEMQATLGSDIALAFDECTPSHADKPYTLRAMERTHRWLDRCTAWHAEHAPAGQALYGIVQGGVHEDLRAESASHVARSPVAGIAIGGSLGQEKAEMHEVLGWSMRGLPEERPRHLLGIGDVDDILHAVARGIDTFDCATPTRLARHGTALVPDPDLRWRLDLTKAGTAAGSRRPIAEGCPCPACREHTRGYLHYLSRAKELTAARLITLHNLTFMAALMRGIREAVRGGRFDVYRDRVMDGSEPFRLSHQG
ncbi:MAG: tRNA guanosine(34) transglycosylase Tgt [Thermoleophilaceae bacterium]|nr:tRNA guanosine(34) transglycosylase Tgt [Thermoleophilaceae bacterium]